MKVTTSRIKNFNVALSGLLAVMVLSACQQELLYEERTPVDLTPVMNFQAVVKENGGAATRTLTQSPYNVEANEFPCYFYIDVNDQTYKNPDDETAPPTNQNKYGVYRVPKNGNGGVLEYVNMPGNEHELNWYNIDDDHYFWSWTLPWTEIPELEVEYLPNPGALPGGGIDPEGFNFSTRDDGEGTGDGDDDSNGNGNDDGDDDGDDDGGDTPEAPSFNPVEYKNTNPITLRLKDTSYKEFHYVNEENEKDSAWNKDSWGNGYFFERFIGAKSGPYDFRTNGAEVPLQFRHLMSKISVRSMLFYAANGNTEEDMQADITFINMPTEFTFYPHPDRDGTPGEDDQYMRKDGPPIVVTNSKSADPNGGVTFGYTHPIDLLPELDPDQKTQYRDKFYICPEVDFSTVKFKLTVSESKYMTRGEYWGDFSQVAFERVDNVDYDRPTDVNGDVPDDSKVLHAGETMYFDLIVKESGGGGYSMYVRDWSTRPTQQAGHHPHPGIYTGGEAVEVLGTGTTWASKFELYGDGFLDELNEPAAPELPNHLGVIHVYGDQNLGNRNSFPVDKNYVIDGMGYVMTFEPSSGSTDVTIGKMIDVYIEISGEMFYIDREGVIYKFSNTANKYMPTGAVIDIHGEKSSWTIDATTGTFK